MLGWNTVDPLLLTRKHHDLSLFTQLFAFDQEGLWSAVGQLLEGVKFLPQSGQADAAGMVMEENTWESLHEDVKACRRRAAFSLITLSKKVSSHMLHGFTLLATQV